MCTLEALPSFCSVGGACQCKLFPLSINLHTGDIVHYGALVLLVLLSQGIRKSRLRGLIDGQLTNRATDRLMANTTGWPRQWVAPVHNACQQ